MLHIPRITPVRVKTEEIGQELIDPGSRGHYFPQEVGPRIVFLDPHFTYPDTTSAGAEGERTRQAEIWNELGVAGVSQFLDRLVEETVSATNTHEVRKRVFEELGTRHTAEFYERVFGELLDTTMNVVAISTGVRPFDGYNYHDIGYIG